MIPLSRPNIRQLKLSHTLEKPLACQDDEEHVKTEERPIRSRVFRVFVVRIVSLIEPRVNWPSVKGATNQGAFRDSSPVQTG